MFDDFSKRVGFIQQKPERNSAVWKADSFMELCDIILAEVKKDKEKQEAEILDEQIKIKIPSNLSNERNLLLTIYGKVSCGKLKFIDDNVEGFVEIPSSFLGEDKYFVLKSDGDSMINAGIKKGDLLVIKMESHAKNGDIAVVELDNKVTLKRFYKLEDKHQYKLHPEIRQLYPFLQNPLPF